MNTGADAAWADALTALQLLARQPEVFDDTVRRVISRALDMSATDAFVAQYLSLIHI